MGSAFYTFLRHNHSPGVILIAQAFRFDMPSISYIFAITS